MSHRGEEEKAQLPNTIEAFYNTERLPSHLDYVSPIEIESKARVAAFAA